MGLHSNLRNSVPLVTDIFPRITTSRIPSIANLDIITSLLFMRVKLFVKFTLLFPAKTDNNVLYNGNSEAVYMSNYL